MHTLQELVELNLSSNLIKDPTEISKLRLNQKLDKLWLQGNPI
jgi:Leucine-rich repeat (LRR) protein